jgi:hypothetical protein
MIRRSLTLAAFAVVAVGAVTPALASEHSSAAAPTGPTLVTSGANANGNDGFCLALHNANNPSKPFEICLNIPTH